MKLLACFFLLVLHKTSAAITKQKDRVIHSTLSDEQPGSPDYDHEAFVGSDAAEEFKKLHPEESKRRLIAIAEKIDRDQDGKITKDELQSWIVFTQRRYMREDSNKQFKLQDSNSDNKIQWKEHMLSIYGFIYEEDAHHPEHDGFDTAGSIEKDKHRWKAADLNNDNELTLEEFQAFLHPEEFERTKNIVAQETLVEMDTDKDGYLSVEEYIKDMYKVDGDEEEPEWVPTEKEHFVSTRDSNKDGKLDVDEVRSWIFPEDYNHAHSEAAHLINVSDDNKDEVLSIDEVVLHYDVFVGSQATDWGEALSRHDEF